MSPVWVALEVVCGTHGIFTFPRHYNDFFRGTLLSQLQQGIVDTYEKFQLPNQVLANNLIYIGVVFKMRKIFLNISVMAPGRHAVWTSPSLRDVTVWRLRNYIAKKLNHGKGGVYGRVGGEVKCCEMRVESSLVVLHLLDSFRWSWEN